MAFRWPQRGASRSRWPLACLGLIGLLALACHNPGPGAATPTEKAKTPPATAVGWRAALQNDPFPYTLPLPEPTSTTLDGVYTKVEAGLERHVPCKRCPDYAPENGLWRLSLDQGTYHIFHEETGWKSLGSFVVSRDENAAERVERLVLFNDPTCPNAVGLYRIRIEGSSLVLDEIEDPCAIRLRAKNLTSLPWLACNPPQRGAGGTGWSIPPGCD